MEVALVTFVGAGITTLAAGFGITVPFGAVANGFQLVRFLSAQDNPRTKRLVTEVVGGIWQDWRNSSLPSSIAAHHLASLPDIMDRLRLPDDVIIGSMASVSSDLKYGGSSAHHHGRQLAAELVAGARDHGALAERDLSEPISFFFLERLYHRLLQERAMIDTLLPTLDAYFHTNGWATPADSQAYQDPDATPPAEADPLRVPAQPLVAIQEVQEVRSSHSTATADSDDQAGSVEPWAHDASPIEDIRPASPSPEPVPALLSAEDCAEIAGRIQQIAGVHELAGQLRLTAAEAMRSGDVLFCDRLLGEAEGHDLKAAQHDIEKIRVHMAAAGETRIVRAYIEELRGNGKRAARHYKAALRCLPTKDRARQLQLIELQVLALMRHGERYDDAEALEEAQVVCTNAGDILSHTANVEEWANWQLTQASLLVSLGRRSGRIELYEAAARHAGSAAEVWLKLQNHSQWAEANLVKAHALRARGDEVRSEAELREAAAVYRSTLGVFARDRTPDQWVAASAGLGQTLVRIGELGGGPSHFSEGGQYLASALDAADRLDIVIDRASFLTARGNGLLGQFADQGGDHLAGEALEAFRTALAICDRDRFTRQALSIRHRLGMALWAFGSRSQSTELLGSAAEELVATLDEAERIEDVARADEVREDLRILSDVLGAADAAEKEGLRRIA